MERARQQQAPTQGACACVDGPQCLQQGIRALATLVHHMGPAHDQRIQLADPFDGLVAVGQLVKDVAHGVEAGALLAVALDDCPGAVGCVRLFQLAGNYYNYIISTQECVLGFVLRYLNSLVL